MRAVLAFLILAVIAAAAYFIFSSAYMRTPHVTQITGPGPETSKAGGAEQPRETSPEPGTTLSPEPVGVPETQAKAPLPVDVPAQQADTKASLNTAIEKFNSGDFESSLALFLEISDRDPGGLTGAGLSYYKLGEYENAANTLERAVSAGDSSYAGRKFLALSYYKLDEMEKSLQRANEALAIKNEPELREFREKLMRERQTQGGFISEESGHFKTIFDGYAHGGSNRKILDILEDAYRDIGGRMDHYPERTITVILYSEKDFFDVTRLPSWTAGAYDGKIRIPVRGIEDQDEAFLRKVLYHEYVHALVHSLSDNVPSWLNEGLAEYLVDRGLEKTGQVIPLDRLDGSFPVDDQRLMMTAYMESYAVVSYLAERHGMFAIKQFIEGLGRGESRQEAWRSAFRSSYDEFLSTWGKG